MPYSRPKLSGLYTLSQIKLLENPSQPHISISPIYIYAIVPPTTCEAVISICS